MNKKQKAIYDIYRIYKTEVELEQTSMNFLDYYEDITGEELKIYHFVTKKGN